MFESQVWGHVLVIPNAGRTEANRTLGFTSRPSLLCEFQAHERSCLKRLMPSIVPWPPCAHTPLLPCVSPGTPQGRLRARKIPATMMLSAHQPRPAELESLQCQVGGEAGRAPQTR